MHIYSELNILARKLHEPKQQYESTPNTRNALQRGLSKITLHVAGKGWGGGWEPENALFSDRSYQSTIMLLPDDEEKKSHLEIIYL
ncbi:hypothetical protein CEXT_429751 [Caerostris extrusa]|uniref:Uncharacterized protein n=1 Tax=Caerostris extrusa TaxID=172846 RepID=A0AAV4Q1F2_CAEEX|nr:hypothetical protein CEXT_429751 [Caerostris extrusa]